MRMRTNSAAGIHWHQSSLSAPSDCWPLSSICSSCSWASNHAPFRTLQAEVGAGLLLQAGGQLRFTAWSYSSLSPVSLPPAPVARSASISFPDGQSALRSGYRFCASASDASDLYVPEPFAFSLALRRSGFLLLYVARHC